MIEAAIVAVARSPIGRAFKGSLQDVRPDDLASSVVRAALDKMPQLDPADIDDLMLGCGLPGGEAGFNMGRVVAVLLGFDHLPGTTITRYCASSLQTTRMAMHAIRAGEGEVFVSAGVEVVSRHTEGSSDSLPDTLNPAFDEARARTQTAADARRTPSTRTRSTSSPTPPTTTNGSTWTPSGPRGKARPRQQSRTGFSPCRRSPAWPGRSA
jgi:acetyl-CoA C-acetyltransferase